MSAKSIDELLGGGPNSLHTGEAIKVRGVRPVRVHKNAAVGVVQNRTNALPNRPLFDHGPGPEAASDRLRHAQRRHEAQEGLSLAWGMGNDIVQRLIDFVV